MTGNRISAIAVAPGNPDRMLVGNQAGIFRNQAALASTAATEWASAAPRAGWVSRLAFDPLDSNIAYATYSTFGGNHVWKSSDGGASWQPLDGSGEGALPDVPVHAIAINPRNTRELYLGTDLGLFVSLDAHMQGLQHPLGREVVGHDPLLDFHWLGGHAERLCIQAKVKDQLFRRAGDAAKIRIETHRILVVHFDPLRTL